LLTPGLALAAAPSPTAKKTEKEAKKACSIGAFETGVELLADLFISSGDPVYIFNQGRCYQENSRPEQAVSRFREYLRKIPDSDIEGRAQAERHIAECQADISRHQPAPVAAVLPQTPKAEVPAPAPAAPAEVIVAQPATPKPPQDSGSSLRTAGVITATLGVVTLGTGLALTLKARSIANDMEAASERPPEQGYGRYQESEESRRSTYATLGYVAYGVGAAAVIGGAVVYWIGQSNSEAGTLALAPVFSAQSAVFVLSGAF
jgi:hypothetical protein